MPTPWSDFERHFSVMDQLRDRLDRAFEEVTWNGRDERLAATSAWPRLAIFDKGDRFDLLAEVPGLSEKDLQLTLVQDVLTIAGERKAETPEGYFVHHQERPAFKFSRSVALPAKVDSEKIVATVKNGILTLTLAKAQEALGRAIKVKAG